MAFISDSLYMFCFCPDGARESVNNHRAKKDVKKVKNEVISDEETEERECHDDSSQVIIAFWKRIISSIYA